MMDKCDCKHHLSRFFYPVDNEIQFIYCEQENWWKNEARKKEFWNEAVLEPRRTKWTGRREGFCYLLIYNVVSSARLNPRKELIPTEEGIKRFLSRISKVWKQISITAICTDCRWNPSQHKRYVGVCCTSAHGSSVNLFFFLLLFVILLEI